MAKEFWREWQFKHVRVTKGPFKGREGQIQGVGNNRCEVAFPESVLQKDRLWFDVSQLEIVQS